MEKNMDRLKQICVALLMAMVVSLMGTGCSADAKKARHLDRAEGYFKSGDYEKAKIEYLNVVRLEPLHPRALPSRRTGFCRRRPSRIRRMPRLRSSLVLLKWRWVR